MVEAALERRFRSIVQRRSFALAWNLVFFKAIKMQEEVYPVFKVIESAALMPLLC